VSWWSTSVSGSSLRLVAGVAGTRDSLNGHDPSWFPLLGTAILGDSGKANPRNPAEHTLAHWTISTNDFPCRFCPRIYLVVASLRRFGGLHSPTFLDRVEIRMNESVLDGFELAHRPDGHLDYFHQMPFPDVPRLKPFSDCENVYAWAVPISHLVEGPEQEVSIRLDRDAKWDIDFLGLLFELPKQRPQVFVSYDSRDLSLARKIVHDLKARGISVWFDEAAIRLGDAFLDRIQSGIALADHFVVLISRSSLASMWVHKEIEIAMSYERAQARAKVVVVLIEDVTLPASLQGKRYADLRSPAKYEDALLGLEELVKSHRRVDDQSTT